LFIAWLLGHHPAKHVICASYDQDLADDLAAACQRVMRSPFYHGLFGEMLGGRQAVNDFETIRGGKRLATSVGGVLTGRGAGIIVLDDPQKADEAFFETSCKATPNCPVARQALRTDAPSVHSLAQYSLAGPLTPTRFNQALTLRSINNCDAGLLARSNLRPKSALGESKDRSKEALDAAMT
jgi:hypothetical protein